MTVDDAKTALSQLLTQASTAIKNAPTANAKIDAANDYARRLADFTIDCLPDDPDDAVQKAGVAAVRNTAGAESQKLSAMAINASVAQIEAHSEELEDIAAELKAGTAANLSADKRLRLEPVTDALARLTDTVNSAATLVDALEADDPSEKAIIDAFGELVSKFRTLRSAVGDASQPA